MARRYGLDNIKLIENQAIFFDANILIYLFWPSGQYNQEKKYSKAFEILLRQKNKLYAHFLIISEIVNRTHRIEYEKYLQNNTKNLNRENFKYKDFRNSNVGEQALADIYLIIQDVILANFHVVEKSFSKKSIQSFLNIDKLDFVDKAIFKICKDNNYVLFTNDGDFKNSDIDILTSNKNIINT